jgi:hypothetical protein
MENPQIISELERVLGSFVAFLLVGVSGGHGSPPGVTGGSVTSLYSQPSVPAAISDRRLGQVAPSVSG